MGPRKLVDIQQSYPPSSRAVHPDKQKVRQKRVDELEAPGPQKGKPTQTSKGSIQRAEARMRNLGGIQRHCPSVQG